MANFEELLAKQSSESQARIAARAEEIRQEITLAKIREELNISQTRLAGYMGVKQPAIVKIERMGNDPKLSTLKRYIKALGGEMAIDVKLPDGKRIELHL